MERVLNEENLRRRHVRDAALAREWDDRRAREGSYDEPAPGGGGGAVGRPGAGPEAQRDRDPSPPAQPAAWAPSPPAPADGGRQPDAAPAAAAPRPEDEPPSAAVCRICHGGEGDGDEPLFSPCNCRGSMGKVHRECLNSWRRMSANPMSYFRCDQCQYQCALRPPATRVWRYRVSQWKYLPLAQSAQVAFVALLLLAAVVGTTNESVRLPVLARFCQFARWVREEPA